MKSKEVMDPKLMDDANEFHPEEIKGWADKVLEAHDLMNDPKKMPHIKKHLAKKVKAINSIADLKRIAKEKINANPEETEL